MNELKAGDELTEDELKALGWTYDCNIAAGYISFEKDDKVMFYHRGDCRIFSIMDKPKFTYP